MEHQEEVGNSCDLSKLQTALSASKVMLLSSVSSGHTTSLLGRSSAGEPGRSWLAPTSHTTPHNIYVCASMTHFWSQ
jgi:hypothetical protein